MDRLLGDAGFSVCHVMLLFDICTLVLPFHSMFLIMLYDFLVFCVVLCSVVVLCVNVCVFLVRMCD